MINFSSIIEEHSHKPAVSGEWFTIQWTPDHATGEKLNIGVCFRESSGVSFTQVLEYYDRIQCLYSQQAIVHLRLACEVAKEIAHLNEYNDKTCISGISFISNGYAQGHSADDIVSSLFNNIVPLAIKKVKGKEKAYYPIGRERLYNIMENRLKYRLAYHEYFEMIEPTPLKRIHLGNQVQTLFVPYKAGRGLATIASAAYSDENMAKCHLYDAQRDISLALSNFNEFDKGAIFILSPNLDLKESKRVQVDDEIDKFCWYLKTQSVFTEVDSDPNSLADKAASWYRRNAA